MVLSKESRIIRWAYILDEPPFQTSLCVVFWRSVVWAPLICAALFVMSPIWLPVGLVMWLWKRYCEGPLKAWERKRDQLYWEKYEAKILRKYDESKRKKEKAPSALTVLWAGVLAVKHRVCPLIFIQ